MCVDIHIDCVCVVTSPSNYTLLKKCRVPPQHPPYLVSPGGLACMPGSGAVVASACWSCGELAAVPADHGMPAGGRLGS